MEASLDETSQKPGPDAPNPEPMTDSDTITHKIYNNIYNHKP